MAIFTYGKTETTWLASRDAKLGEAIELIGPIEREVDPKREQEIVPCSREMSLP